MYKELSIYKLLSGLEYGDYEIGEWERVLEVAFNSVHNQELITKPRQRFQEHKSR